GLSSRNGKHSMALWVKPPPHGFSHAKCSSKILTLCPARASCSPHIAPEGPPPIIATSVIFSNLLAKLVFQACKFQAAGSFPPKNLLGDGENHQAKSSQKYSTEDRSRQRGPGLASHKIYPHALKHRKHPQKGRQQNHQNRPAV